MFQNFSCKTAVGVGGFDVCIAFNETSFDDEEYRSRNRRILQTKTGGGLWVWKSYIILKTMLAMKDDDVLFYNDATIVFIDNMDFGHVCLMDQNKLDFGLFSVIYFFFFQSIFLSILLEGQWTFG